MKNLDVILLKIRQQENIGKRFSRHNTLEKLIKNVNNNKICMDKILSFW